MPHICVCRVCGHYNQRARQVNDLDTSQTDTVSSLQGELEMAVGEQCDCVRSLANDKGTQFLTATESLIIV